jgi:hypothetical protein
MDMTMTDELIKFLGGTTIVVAAVAWLIKSLVSHFLSKDVESYKQQLQSESTVELERLRHELRLLASAHEKQMHLLQEQRAKTIAELYSKLIDFLAAAESFANIVEWSGEPPKEKKAELLGEKAIVFYEYFRCNRIYFTEDLCQKVDALFKEVNTSMLSYRFWMARAKKSDQASIKMDDAWDKAWDLMQEKVPLLLSAIETEFRTLLGVSASAPTDKS